MSAKVLSIGIAGWGDASANKPYRLRARSSLDVSSTVLPFVGLSSWPSAVANSVNPATLERATGTFSFDVTALESAAGAALLAFLFQASPRPWCALNTDCNASETTLYVTRILGEDVPSATCLLYLEREVIRCGGITDNGDGTFDLKVTRGRYGTQAAAHSSELYADRYVYSANPIADSREVTLYDLDLDADTETAWWSGFLEPPRLSSSLGILSLSAQDALGLVRGVHLGRDRLVWRGAKLFEQEDGRIDIVTPNPAKCPTGVVRQAFGFTMVTDGELALAGNLLSTDVSKGSLVRFGGAGRQPVYGTKPKTGEVDLFEALVVGHADHEFDDWAMVRREGGDLSAHPFDIVLNLLESTGTADPTTPTVGSNGSFDWLSRHWGLGIPSSRIDEAGIIALRDSRWFRSARVDNFILSAKELPKAHELMRRLLSPLLCFLAQDSSGQLTIRSLVDTGATVAATITDAELAGRVEAQDARLGGEHASSTLKLCRRGLGDDFAMEVTDASLRDVELNRYPLGRETLEVDCGDYGAPGGDSIPPYILQVLRSVNRLRYELLVARLPPYQLWLHGDVARLAVGDWIDLTVSSLVGPDGVEGSVSGHRCLVLTSEQETDTDRQRVTVLDLSAINRATQRVAPCWEIESVAGSREFDIHAARFTADDAAQWVDNAKVLLFTCDGVLRSTDGASYGTITGTTVGLDGGPWLAGGSPLTPVAGDIIRVAFYDEAWPEVAYLADANAELGSGDPPHRWGT